ncbi:MAG TPA: aminotransferase class III-fold pyridoxal phosphate-dependent enzyme [Terriglobales bacterium]|nr:aminotransferase class III-fold pyridoxal phosphate-dependent enzyme [Terriglobales bacterium]
MDAIDKLIDHLVLEYRKKTPKSGRVFARASKVMISGGSHSIRLWHPYPFLATRAEGPSVRDADGRSYVDYWQGHYANILGHNPRLVRRGMGASLERGCLHTGFESAGQIELAELILRQLGAADGRVRFTTSGTLATMYSVMLAEGFTGRDLVLKVGGGWHGASPYLLKGVRFKPGAGFEADRPAGVLEDILKRTLITRFNDGDDLERIFKAKGDRIACFILEPFLGVGGFLPASREYLALARELTRRHDAVLIFDEVISGFRFAPAGVQTLYGVSPDLSVFGKIIGGGHAVAAVVGRRDIMEGCETGRGLRGRVPFDGGTFSAHSEYMKAGLVMLRHLVRHAGSVYPRLARSGETLREGVVRAFASEGVPAVCTGAGNDALPGSSMVMAHFPIDGARPARPEDLHDGRRFRIRLREEALKLALLVHGVNVVHGGGAVSTAHGPADLERTIAAYGEAARLFKKFLF